MTGIRWGLVLIGLAFLVGCQPAGEEDVASRAEPEAKQPMANAKQSQQDIAMSAKYALFKQLSGRLVEAMSTGGPAAAIEVCRVAAPKIATRVGAEYGVKIGRTSFKLRNATNVPPAWAQPHVASQTGEPQFVDLPDGRLGALLPIFLKAQCLQCHGPTEQIADDVKAQLAQLYPDDRATGFAEGDLRGWFWVEVPASVSFNRE